MSIQSLISLHQVVDPGRQMIGGKDIWAPKYIKQILTDLKEMIASNIIIVWDFNTLLSTMGKSFRQEINMKTLDVNYTVHQTDLTDTQNIPSHSTRIRKLFTCIWHILQDRSHARLQNKSQQIFKDCNHIRYLFWPQQY